jgi:hypothetical protein
VAGNRSQAVSGLTLRWKTTNLASWAERLFGSYTIVEIKHVTKMEWFEKEIFLKQKKIVNKNLGCCSLNKNKLLN